MRRPARDDNRALRLASLTALVTSTSAGKDADMAEAWLVERVRGFRALDFFKAQSALGDDELADYLVRCQEEVGDPFYADDPYVGAQILLHDGSRVWFNDMEADVCEENQVYAATLDELAEISRGAFAPTDIVETWESEIGPIRVEFSQGGERYAFEPDYEDDWIVFDFLKVLNKLLAPKGVAFVTTGWDQRAWIAAVTTAERASLEKLGVALE
jgi:hypothetical protein